MGMYAVNFKFDCVDDEGVDMSVYGSDWQEMDAFIGYAGKGKEPPFLIKVDKDRVCRNSHTGELYDPEVYGNEDNVAFPQTFKGQYCRVKIETGKATELKMMTADEWSDAEE